MCVFFPYRFCVAGGREGRQMHLRFPLYMFIYIQRILVVHLFVSLSPTTQNHSERTQLVLGFRFQVSMRFQVVIKNLEKISSLPSQRGINWKIVIPSLVKMTWGLGSHVSDTLRGIFQLLDLCDGTRAIGLDQTWACYPIEIGSNGIVLDYISLFM